MSRLINRSGYTRDKIIHQKSGVGNGIYEYQDPLILGFKLYFTIGLNNNTIGGLLGHEQNPNSALFYLKTIGDNARFKMLKYFIEILYQTSVKNEWYFSKIEGLDTILNWDISKIGYDSEIKIECLESIDMRMITLANLYRNIYFDWINFREILPINLQWFDVCVRVFDPRDFTLDSKSTSYNEDLFLFGSSLPNEKSHLAFNLSRCIFNFQYDWASSIDNTNLTHASTNFHIKFTSVYEEHLFKFLYNILNDNQAPYVKSYLNSELDFFRNVNYNETTDPLVKTLGSVYEDSILQNTKVDDIVNSNLVNRAINTVRKIIKNPTRSELGNVYGVTSLTSAFNALPSGVISDITKVAGTKIANIVSNKINRYLLGNVYDGSNRITKIKSQPNKLINDVFNL